MPVVYEKQIRRNKRRQGMFKKVLATIQSASVGCSMSYYYFKSEPSETTIWLILRCLLILIWIASYLLWALARYQLGTALAFGVSTDGPFITSGLYSKFRNPIYLFGTIALTSYLLIINRPMWLLILLVLVPMQYVRSARESRALMKKYDEQYEAYLQQVWL